MLFSTSWVQAQQKTRGNLILKEVFMSGMAAYLFCKAIAPPSRINGSFATVLDLLSLAAPLSVHPGQTAPHPARSDCSTTHLAVPEGRGSCMTCGRVSDAIP